MDRTERNGVVRYDVRRKGLAAILLLAAVPWTVAGALSLHPAYFVGSSLFLAAAMAAVLPVRSLFINRAAGTLIVQSRTWGVQVRRDTLPLAELRRQGGEFLLDLPGGPLRLPATGKLADDLGA